MADEVYEGAIGIDLGEWLIQIALPPVDTKSSTGTTYSCVANYEGTNVEISTSTTANISIMESFGC